MKNLVKISSCNVQAPQNTIFENIILKLFYQKTSTGYVRIETM